MVEKIKEETSGNTGQGRKYEVSRSSTIKDRETGKIYRWHWVFGLDTVELINLSSGDVVGTMKLNVCKKWSSPQYNTAVHLDGVYHEISKSLRKAFEEVCNELIQIEDEIYDVLKEKVEAGAEMFSKKELSKRGLLSFGEWEANSYNIHMKRYEVLDEITDWVLRSAILSTLTGNEDDLETICRDDSPVWREFEYRISDLVHDDERQ